MSENPVIHLFDSSYKGWTRRYKQKYPKWAKWYALAMFIYVGLGGLVTIALATHQFGLLAGWGVLLAEVGGLTALVIPASAAGGVFMGLQSLRKGRSLEEILASGITARQIVDGFVLASLRHLSRFTLVVWLVLLAGSGFLLDVAPWAPLLALAWLPLVAVLSVAGAYHWGRHAVAIGFDYGRQMVVMSALMIGLTGVLVTCPPQIAVPVLVPAVLVMLGVALWLSRCESIDRVSRACQPLRRQVQRPACGPLPEGNPLVVRETMRRLSWSFWARNWDAILSLGFALLYGLAISWGPETAMDPAVPLLLFWWVLVMVAPLRAAFRSLEVFQADRQARALDSLLLTRLTATEAVEGAARLGWERPLREVVLGGLLLLPLGFGLEVVRYGNLVFVPKFASLAAGSAFFAAWFLVAMLAGSYLGVAAGARGATRQEAWMKLGGWGLQAYFSFYAAGMVTLLPVLLIFGAEGTGQATFMAVYMLFIFVVAPYVLWRWSRTVAYRSVSNRPDHPGFA